MVSVIIQGRIANSREDQQHTIVETRGPGVAPASRCQSMLMHSHKITSNQYLVRFRINQTNHNNRIMFSNRHILEHRKSIIRMNRVILNLRLYRKATIQHQRITSLTSNQHMSSRTIRHRTSLNIHHSMFQRKSNLTQLRNINRQVHGIMNIITNPLRHQLTLSMPIRLQNLRLIRMSTNRQILHIINSLTNSTNTTRRHLVLFIRQPRMRIPLFNRPRRHLNSNRRLLHIRITRRINSHLNNNLTRMLILDKKHRFLMNTIRRRFNNIQPIRRTPIKRNRITNNTSRHLRHSKIRQRRTIKQSTRQDHLPRLLNRKHSTQRIQHKQGIVSSLARMRSTMRHTIAILISIVRHNIKKRLNVHIRLPRHSLTIIHTRKANQASRTTNSTSLKVHLNRRRMITNTIHARRIQRRIRRTARIFNRLHRNNRLHLTILRHIIRRTRFNIKGVLSHPNL